MVSFIIVNYKSLPYIEKCVNSIFQNISSTPFEIIIVNNSPEENLVAVKQGKENIIIIESQNKGFAAGCNFGSKFAKGEFLFFLNPDTILLNDFFPEMLQYFGNKEFGVIGLKLFNQQNLFQISFGSFPTFIGEIKNKKLKNNFRKGKVESIKKIELKYQNISVVDWVSGAALVIRKSTFKLIEGFDERYFLYYEDADLCKRVSDRGYKNYFFPFGKIIHLEAENIKPDFSEIYFYAKKSQLTYYKLHNGLLQTILLRIYLSFKFGVKYLLSFNNYNLKLFLVALGVIK